MKRNSDELIEGLLRLREHHKKILEDLDENLKQLSLKQQIRIPLE